MYLQVRNLDCEKGQQRLFSAVDFSLDSGELLHVAGENGSGKTTLLRIIAGLNRDYNGDVLWQEKDIRNHWPDYSQDILYLGHQPALKAQLTARENLQWYARCSNDSSLDVTNKQVDTALNILGLDRKKDIPCHQLSAGQQRRAVLSRLMFSKQKIWILDEPFTAIDVQGFMPILQCLRLHMERGGIIVMTTHHGMEKLNLLHKQLNVGPA